MGVGLPGPNMSPLLLWRDSLFYDELRLSVPHTAKLCHTQQGWGSETLLLDVIGITHSESCLFVFGVKLCAVTLTL